jgi:hypothetical protein
VNFVSRFVVGLLLALLTACGEHPESKEPGQNPSPVVKNKTIPPPLPAAAVYEKKQKQEYEARLEAILNGYQHMIEDLKSKAKSSVSATKENSPDTIAALEVKTEALTSVLNRLKLASLKSWQDLKPEIHAVLDDLEASYDKAALALRDSPERRDPASDPRTPQTVVPVSAMAESN